MSRTNSVQGRRRRGGPGALGRGLWASPLLSALAVAAPLTEAQAGEGRPSYQTRAVVPLLVAGERGSCRALMMSVVRCGADLVLLTPSRINRPVPLAVPGGADGSTRLVIETKPVAGAERLNLAVHRIHVPADARLSKGSLDAFRLADPGGEEHRYHGLLAIDPESPPPRYSAMSVPATDPRSGWYQRTVPVDVPPGAHLGPGAPMLQGGEPGELLAVVAGLKDWKEPSFVPMPAWAKVIDLAHTDPARGPSDPAQGSYGKVVVTKVFGPMLDHLLGVANRAPFGTLAEAELPEPGLLLDKDMKVRRIDTVGPERRAGVIPGDQVLRVNGDGVGSPEDVLAAYLRAPPRGEVELLLRNDLWREDRTVRVVPQSGDALDRAHLAAAGLAVGRDPGMDELFVTDLVAPRGFPAPPLPLGSYLLGGLIEVHYRARQRVGEVGDSAVLVTIGRRVLATDFAGSRARLLEWLRMAAATGFPAWLRVLRDDGWVERVPRDKWEAMAAIVRANVAGR